MKLVIIDYGAGNIKSIQFAFKRLGLDAILTNSIEEIESADKVIFPGVGEASSAMKMLRESGLDKIIPNLKQPVLGICLGMQLMCKQVKVPQIGWNGITNLKTKLFSHINENEYMYTVHSFYVPLCKETIAITDYELPHSSALHKNNFYGVQFHPEKSSSAGEQLLKNFLEL